MRNIDQSDATDETIESDLLLRQHKINENISNRLFNTCNVIIVCCLVTCCLVISEKSEILFISTSQPQR